MNNVTSVLSWSMHALKALKILNVLCKKYTQTHSDKVMNSAILHSFVV